MNTFRFSIFHKLSIIPSFAVVEAENQFEAFKKMIAELEKLTNIGDIESIRVSISKGA